MNIITDDSVELCVICKCPTEYVFSTPIQQRSVYVVGVGQVCKGCFKAVYGKQAIYVDREGISD